MRARRTVAAKALWKVLLGSRRTGGIPLGERLRVVPRMVVAAMRGRYPHLSRGRLAMMAVALVYVISPIDIVPEAFLALLGLGDDALVVAWLAGALLGDTEQFVAWEREQQRTVRGNVVR